MIKTRSLAVWLLMITIGVSTFTQPLQAEEVDEPTNADESVIVDESILPPSYRVQDLPESQFGPVGDFVVGPGKVELEVELGQSANAEISISNRTGSRASFTLVVEDATGSQDPNTPIVLLGDDTGPYTLKDYISIEDKTFTLEHNQKVTIPVKVSLPADAEPGGRYGSVLITTNSVKAENREDQAPSSAIISRIGTLFFVTTPGLDTRDGQLKDFTTVPKGKSYYTKGPINFGILYENVGNVHVSPYGEIRIKNLFGEEVGIIEVDPWYSMPHSVRLREIEFPREWLFGYYTATIELNRGYDDIIDTQSLSFVVIDWILVAKIFAGLILLIFFIKFLGSRFEFRRK